MSYHPPNSDGEGWKPNTGPAQFDVSVVRPINPAIDWIKGVLFPFDFTRWLTLTVPVFLLFCAESGGGFNYSQNIGGPGPGPAGGSGLEDIPAQVDPPAGPSAPAGSAAPAAASA